MEQRPLTIAWSEKLELGEPLIDLQHRKLTELHNDFVAAVETGHASAIIHAVVDVLVSYVAVHFDDEERLMASIDYPHLDEHRQLHAELRHTLDRFVALHRSGAIEPEQFADFFRLWLLRHIAVEDQKIAAHARRDS